MSYKKSKKNKGIVGGIVAGLVTILIVGGLGGLLHTLNKKGDSSSVSQQTSTSLPSINPDPSTSTSLEESVAENGIRIRLLESRPETAGVVKTFSYTVLPENATNQSIITEVTYSDGTPVGYVTLEVTVNETSKTISIKCKEAFDKIINVKLTSVDNPSATATITLNYVKKINNMIVKESFVNALGGLGSADPDEYHVNQKINYLDYFVPNYSLYTKDKNYTFKLDNLALSNYKNNTIVFDETGFGSFSRLVTSFREYFENQIKGAFNSESTFELDENAIWNLSDNNTYHSNLKKIGEASMPSLNIVGAQYLEYDILLDFSCVENPDVKCSYNGKVFIFLYGLFTDSAYKVSVDSLNTESTTNIDF